jgi:hypothetical protein
MNGTVSWSGVYGPNTGGQVVGSRSSTSIMDSATDRLPLTLPVIVLIGVLAWWALEKWD